MGRFVSDPKKGNAVNCTVDVFTWRADDEVNVHLNERGPQLRGDQLSEELQQQLDAILMKYNDVFSNISGMIELTMHKYDTGDHTPIRLPAYRVPLQWREAY